MNLFCIWVGKSEIILYHLMVEFPTLEKLTLFHCVGEIVCVKYEISSELHAFLAEFLVLVLFKMNSSIW